MSSYNGLGCYLCGDPLDDILCRRCSCGWCGNKLNDGFCSYCASKAGNSFAYDPNLNSFDNSPNHSDYSPQPWYETNIYIKTLNDDLEHKEQAAKISISRKFPVYDDDDNEYSIQTQEYLKKFSSAITPDLPITDSLIMEDEHLDTIPVTESANTINMGDEHLDTTSSIENLVPIPSEFKGISDDTSNVPNNRINVESDLVESLINRDTSIVYSSKIDPILEEFAGELAHIAPIPPGIVEADFDPNDDISSDDDDFEDIEYVSFEEVNDVEQEEKEFDLEDILQIQDVILRERLEADFDPKDGTSSDDDDFVDIEYVSLEEVNDVNQEEKEFDLDDILQIKDVILREKLLNINRLFANIESLKDNPTPDRVLNSPFSFHISVVDSDSFFEKSDTSLSHLDNSLPEFETFSDHTEETRSGSTTTHANYSLPEYDSFLFEIVPDQEGLISIDNSNDSLLEIPKFESFYFDDPSFPRPPPEPPDVKICLHFEPDAPVIDNFNELNDDQEGGEIDFS
ncbi:hypothetical protein Tco_0766640 [Tanacetum coccineum]